MNNDASTLIPVASLRGILDFNFSPVVEMDDSWWQPEWLAVPLFNRLKGIKAARRKLSIFILESYELEHESYFDFTSYEKRAALLKSADLKALLYSMGLIVQSEAIAAVIQRETQHAIRKALGETDYLYALKNKRSIDRTQFQSAATDIQKHAHDAASFKDYIHQSGLYCLLSLLENMPQGFIQRILFKLPKAWHIPSLVGGKKDCREIKACLPRLFKELKIQ